MPRILVTNDDGVHSEGIHALAAALRPLGDVLVVAPHIEASAIGHALTLRRPLRIEELREGVYEVDGTPTDCVNIAITKLFNGLPDLIVSGINKGYNLGDDVTYSGTVSGALEGALLGVPSIAVSLARSSGKYDFGPAAAAAAAIAALTLARRVHAADLRQPQRAGGEAEGLQAHRAGETEPRDDRRRTVRPARQAVLLDRRRGERLGAARPLRFPGRARRIRLRHAAAAGHDRLRGAGEARDAGPGEHTMRFARLIPLVLALACLLPAAARAQDPVHKDHPRFSGMPNYEISNVDDQDFGAGDFEMGPGKEAKHVEGHYWKFNYNLKEGQRKAGPLQIGRNYTALLTAKGGTKLFEELAAGGGTTTGTMPIGNGRTLWLQVDVNNSGESYALTIVEEGEMKQEVEFTAGDLAEALKSKGSVTVRNILFDTGKATIKPESAGALAVIADALKSDGTLKVEIQGHTDNVGAAAANLKLSQDRAAAVKAYLVQTGGIAAGRLTTAGLGDTKPVGDNTTEEGRGQNRRGWSWSGSRDRGSGIGDRDDGVWLISIRYASARDSLV